MKNAGLPALERDAAKRFQQGCGRVPEVRQYRRILGRQ